MISNYKIVACVFIVLNSTQGPCGMINFTNGKTGTDGKRKNENRCNGTEKTTNPRIPNIIR